MSQPKLSAFFQKKNAEDAGKNARPEKAKQPRTDDMSPGPSIPVKKRKKNWQSEWLTEFSWLRKDSEQMFCTVCEKFEGNNPKSVWSKGCTNFQHSALSRHQSTPKHARACLSMKQERYMTAAVEIVKKRHEPILEAQLRTALYLAKENVSDKKFHSLIDLQISNAHVFASTSRPSSLLSAKQTPGIYTNHQAASDMQGYLADVVKEMAIVRIRSSPFLGIMVDESLDIATTKKLVMFSKIMHNGDIKIEFCANIEIQDGKADTVYSAIVDWLKSVGLGIEKVSGFGSDGASVMTGKHAGVGVKLRADNPRIIHIWCAAHRLALVTYWAAKHIPYLQTLQQTLINIYNFYEYSAPRYNKIKELKRIMGGKVRKFKKPTQVRWLSLQDAIEAVYNSWSALVLGLEHEVAASPQSEGGNKAKGILKSVKSFRFISSICLLKDILGWICKLSRIFQKDVININHVVTMINATKDTLSSFEGDVETPSVVDLIESLDQDDGSETFQGIELSCTLRDRLMLMNLRKTFIQNILLEFDERFPDDDMKVLKDLNAILNPDLLPGNRDMIQQHGIVELGRILDFYGNLFVKDDVKQNFLQFKFYVNVNRHLSIQEFCSQLVKEPEVFPDFAKMAALLMTVPMTSVPCERGFSSQNRHISKYTNKRSVINVENRMFIEYESKQPGFDEDAVIKKACEKFN